MCPACFGSTAVVVAGAGSAAGIVAVYLGRFTDFFRATRFALFHKNKEK